MSTSSTAASFTQPALDSDSSADAEWQAIQDFMGVHPAAASSRLEMIKAYESRALALKAKAMAFYQNYPTDPRRWKAAMMMLRQPPSFILDFGHELPGGKIEGAVVDQPAAAAWKTRLDELRAEMTAASDLPESIKEQLAADELAMQIRAAMETNRSGGAVDLGRLTAKFMIFASHYPQSASGSLLLHQYLSVVQAVAPDQVESQWQLFADSPNDGIKTAAQDKLRFYALTKAPFEMKFTAVDGREVDLAQLRGKVVLVDFWATWCGPCRAEVPNVVAVYEKYRAQGFEVVGISLDKAEDKQKLIDYTQANAMRWPQHFDGKGWKNELAVKYAVNSIPAMFLLNKRGIFVPSQARGPKLEEEVRKQLAL